MQESQRRREIHLVSDEFDNRHLCVLRALQLWEGAPPPQVFHRLVIPEQPAMFIAEGSASRRLPHGLTQGEIWQPDHAGGQLQAFRPIPVFQIEATAKALAQEPPFFKFEKVIDDLNLKNLIGHAESTAWPFPLRLTWKMPSGQMVDLEMIEQGDDEHGHEVMVFTTISGGLPVIVKPYPISDPDNGLDERYVWALRLTNQGRAWLLPVEHQDEGCSVPGQKAVDSLPISLGTPEDQPASDSPLPASSVNLDQRRSHDSAPNAPEIDTKQHGDVSEQAKRSSKNLMTDAPNAEGYVASPADPTAYLPASEIRTKHTPAEVEVTAKQIPGILKDYKSNRIRWTRPLGREGKPRENRLKIHLSDWVAYCARRQGTGGAADKTDWPQVSEDETSERTKAIRQRKVSGK